MINYTFSVSNISADNLIGFFVGWPNPPSPEKHLEILKNSHYTVIARDGDKVVGFVNALSDKILSVYIPLLEILPEYQNKGIGRTLIEKLLVLVDKYYMVDLSCDPEIQKFYEKLNMKKSTGMSLRNYQSQSGL